MYVSFQLNCSYVIILEKQQFNAEVAECEQNGNGNTPYIPHLTEPVFACHSYPRGKFQLLNVMKDFE